MIQYLTRLEASQAVSDKIDKVVADTLALPGSDGFISDVSHFLISPAAIIEPIQPINLHHVIVANLNIDNATEEASLQNGVYNIRLAYEGDVLVAELLMGDAIIKKAKTVRLIPTTANFAHPEATVLEVTSAAIFLGGVVAGMCLAIYMMK